MKNEVINNNQIIAALNNDWKTAAQLREELQLEAGAKKIGQALRKIRLDNRNIQTKMRGRVLLYRLPKEEVTPIIISQEVVPDVKPPKDIAKELEGLIHDLKSQGVNVQEICYLALRDRKEKLESELRYVMKNAPTFAEEYQKLKDELQRMKNQLQDYKDIVDKVESQDLIKRFSEDRRVKAGVISG